MFKPNLILAGAAFLFAGFVQADAPNTQAEPARTTIAKQEAPAPAAGNITTDSADKSKTREANQELHPDARPVYLNGGYFGE